ncbi:ferrous iron transport protein B [Lactovum miscens]|uniref:Ferrous iron transport protein B n=1 Tax=Lactovum miscens TaxID=190387 RepID=A0A841C8G3_9LACT|nr:ferrous iron transport protein B [Lactovum miscens]MBB5887872.1 ferrous iron transport protein B [Lactovum miscens]
MTTIALVGNPNCGKSSVFNILTRSNQTVGNWPGVTVERKSGTYKKDKSVLIQDLPGIYSLSPFSLDEKVSRDYLLKSPPDAIVNIVDATNLERSLYLTLQLIDFGIPMIIGLNMMDLMKSAGKIIDVEKLSYSLGLHVVEMSVLKNHGLNEAIDLAKKDASRAEMHYDARLEASLSEISNVIKKDEIERYSLMSAFEGDFSPLKDELNEDQKNEISEIRSITEKIFDDEALEIVVNERYALIEQVMQLVAKDSGVSGSLTDKIDRIVTSKWLGIPVFILIMWLVYFVSIQTVGNMGTIWLNDVLFGKIIPEFLTNLMGNLKIVTWLQDLVLNGILAGVGATLAFIPQIFVLFILLGILEDSGYMARVAFVMDRIFRHFGLSGKSFIPMLIASGCGVPAIMATRTIEQDRDRRITIMVTTFMPCSAKLPIIALVSAAFFPGNPWIAPSAYFLGMGMIIISGIILKKLRMFSGNRSAFIMELPNYHLPQAWTVIKYGLDKAFSFIKRAATIIFVVSVGTWLLSNYNFLLHKVNSAQSMLADLGRLIAWVFAPLGFGEWQAALATITGLAAKETIVGTLGVLYGNGNKLTSAFSAHYSAAAGYSFLAFNLLCAPCIASISTIFKEMGSVKWGLRALSFQTAIAYMMSFVIYQFAKIFSNGFDFLSFFAIIVVIVGLYFIFRPSPKEILA